MYALHWRSTHQLRHIHMWWLCIFFTNAMDCYSISWTVLCMIFRTIPKKHSWNENRIVFFSNCLRCWYMSFHSHFQSYSHSHFRWQFGRLCECCVRWRYDFNYYLNEINFFYRIDGVQTFRNKKCSRQKIEKKNSWKMLIFPSNLQFYLNLQKCKKKWKKIYKQFI